MKEGFFMNKNYLSPSLFSAEGMINYVRKKKPKLLKNVSPFPERAILYLPFGKAPFLKGQKDIAFSHSFCFLGLNVDIYRPLKKKSKSLAVVSSIGMGAPSAVVCLEKLRALKVKKFISIGLAGALTSNLKAGELKVGEALFIKKAFRDEGTSYHYKTPSPCYVECQKGFNKGLNFVETQYKHSIKKVCSWTTDAPFRETKQGVLGFYAQGAKCVEMEASALMAVGEYYDLPVACFAVISDELSPQGFLPNFFNPLVKKNLHNLMNQLYLF